MGVAPLEPVSAADSSVRVTSLGLEPDDVVVVEEELGSPRGDLNSSSMFSDTELGQPFSARHHQDPATQAAVAATSAGSGDGEHLT